MNLTIYIDVLFLLNLIINYIVLITAAFICNDDINTKRIILASVFGAIYSVIIFFPELELLNIILIRICVSILIVLIAFKYINAARYIKTIFVYYFINAVYGGGIYLFYNFTSFGSKMNFSNGIYYIDLPFYIILILTFSFYYLIKLFSKIANRKITQRCIRKIDIYFENTKISTNALLDTGNSLYDPISLLPVMLIEKDMLMGKISENILNEISKADSSSLILVHNMYPNLKFRIIPFKDVTGNKTNVFAFKPKEIINAENGKKYNHMLIGIINAKLSEDNSYNALLHSEN